MRILASGASGAPTSSGARVASDIDALRRPRRRDPALCGCADVRQAARDAEREGGSHADGALDGERPAEQPRQPPRQCEPEPGALRAVLKRVLELRELLEDPLLIG